MKSLIVTLGASTCGFVLLAAEEPRPNFIFFLSDDISQEDHGCYGHPVIKTPHIDALAKNGVRFDRAYLAISSCSPSRCNTYTGGTVVNSGNITLSGTHTFATGSAGADVIYGGSLTYSTLNAWGGTGRDVTFNGTLDELEAKWPVADLVLRRVPNIVFRERVIPPRPDKSDGKPIRSLFITLIRPSDYLSDRLCNPHSELMRNHRRSPRQAFSGIVFDLNR
jgi:hypothetical protein